MFLVDFEKDLENERIVTDDPVVLLEEILKQAPQYRPLVVRIERVAVRAKAGHQVLAQEGVA